ncbi:hypothetical protein [Kineococcus aurantiacus]|uniref:Uncharacterized protein n=1 Tax=Kineococcus aurantiacus TaxID=37633 RepID=A0A7Y9DML8_9ACTN|nr:hypothetical protein [Kineococcus aurantiacus]NYD23309.1 hypothetical protein [Kineococcus aurantiacus]
MPRRAVLAGTLTTAAFAAWRWGFSPTVGTGTLLPWTVLGLVVVLATIGADRLTRPFVGTATTAVAAAVADLLTGAGHDSAPSGVLDVLDEFLYAAFAAGALAAAVSGGHLLFARLPRAHRPRAGAVAILGASAWVAWMGWWPLDNSGPARAGVLVAAAAGTLVLATVLGELTLGRWRGAVFALVPAALLAVAPLAASDSLGLVVWMGLTTGAAVVCLTAVGVVAAVRGTHRRLRPAAR